MTRNTHLVLGATGKTGRRIAARLRVRGTPVRAASRSSRVRFDWSEPDGWDTVLRDVDVAYVVPPPVPGPVHAFVARASAAGVRRLVLLSGRGADDWGDSPFGEHMRSAEEAVRGSSLEWTLLRASNFAQNFDEDIFHAPLVAGGLALPAGEVPEPFVDIEDLADAAVAVMTGGKRHAGRVYELSGPRALTFDRAVELIALASGRPLTYRRITPDAYITDLIGQGLSRPEAEDIAAMFVLMESGVIAGTTDDLPALLGRAPRTFEEYVARTAATGAWDER
ncbi:NAD(P)H-binding protein [Streptomyces sp. XM4011]|uniref:NmrA family NAD(P)-binding protein n=1 Tax=Streptomyces sp. XM4011 TaxID=2929780 RepID=UPI001FFAABF6|nr:NAD(P)H-binding protein [Streptomyces sp. XM4011]MCK1812840.1 NAD(P)H-binding protein [Streptomyces sp. XM4011]